MSASEPYNFSYLAPSQNDAARKTSDASTYCSSYSESFIFRLSKMSSYYQCCGSDLFYPGSRILIRPFLSSRILYKKRGAK
jgi:hypothetical protein